MLDFFVGNKCFFVCDFIFHSKYARTLFISKRKRRFNLNKSNNYTYTFKKLYVEKAHSIASQ